MKIVVGLGNPGSEYQKTRHNFGFLVLDKLSKLLDLSFIQENKFKAKICQATINGHKVLLVKPDTFMNLSGEAVNLIKSYYRLENKDVWVVTDELDLPLGKIRIRQNSKTSTHNGLKNITTNIGEDFTRIRLGISGDPSLPVDVFVLSKFEKKEQELVNEVVEKTASLLINALEQDSLADHTIDLVA